MSVPFANTPKARLSKKRLINKTALKVERSFPAPLRFKMNRLKKPPVGGFSNYIGIFLPAKI